MLQLPKKTFRIVIYTLENVNISNFIITGIGHNYPNFQRIFRFFVFFPRLQIYFHPFISIKFSGSHDLLRKWKIVIFLVIISLKILSTQQDETNKKRNEETTEFNKQKANIGFSRRSQTWKNMRENNIFLHSISNLLVCEANFFLFIFFIENAYKPEENTV